MRFGSVCSGIEAASVAWEPLGWHAAWFSEIEPFPCAVLSHHYPSVPNLGDMTAAWIAKALSVLHALTLSAIAISARSIIWLSLAAKRVAVALSATWHLSRKSEEAQPPKDYAPMPRLLSLKELAARMWIKHD